MPTPLRIPARVRYSLLSDLGSKHRAKPVPPKPDRLMADVDPSLGERIISGELLKYRNGSLTA
jgi:hypothetical protein